jgi:chorismate mutase
MEKMIQVINGIAVEMTDAEIAQLEAHRAEIAKDIADYENAKKAEADAKIALEQAKEETRKSAVEKLSKLGLTEQEVNSIIS